MSRQLILLLEYAKDGCNTEHREINFSKIPNFKAQEILKNTGVKVHGALVVITASGIRHAIKQHSDHRQQQLRFQVGITDRDFLQIPDILLNPDEILKGNDSSREKQSLKFIKKINGKQYFVIMSLDTRGSLSLVFNTMFIKQ